MGAPGFEILDPRPNQRESPYTFFIPGPDELAEVEPGMLVKLLFRAVPSSKRYDAERMWVQVIARDGDALTGTLDNDPRDMPGLKNGDPVSFRLHHIIGIIWDDERKARFARDFDKWFARCFVDRAVLEQRARVGFIYRETPEQGSNSEFHDTGWRIRADVAQLSDEEYEDTKAAFVAIGAVLNRDDSFVDLLLAPVGSAFVRGEGDGYEPTRPSFDDWNRGDGS